MTTSFLEKAAGLSILAAMICFGQVDKPQLRAGVSVELVKSRHAAVLRAADDLDAVVVAVTEKGNVYVGVERSEAAAAGAKAWAAAKGKLIYLKADARAAGGAVEAVLAGLRAAGARELGLLTDQKEAGEAEFPRPPRGFVVALAGGGRVVSAAAQVKKGETVQVPVGTPVRSWLELVDACVGQGAKVGL